MTNFPRRDDFLTRIENLTKRVAALEVKDDTGWLSPTLLGGWLNYGGAWAPSRYRRKNGIVYVQGLVKSGAGTIFVLPVGFRPAGGVLYFGTDTDTGTPTVSVDGAGNVNMVRGSTAWLSLTGVTFPAEA